ncbi:hypothetical protein [Chondromyces crocatus]|nr:hypothetical protein [Chondromyces crocatus]
MLSSIPPQFASVRAEIRLLDPGTCMPQGGEFVGGFEPSEATTFCCAQER